MIKTLQWIYALGVKAERHRIELLIKANDRQKPERPTDSARTDTLKKYDFDMAVWREVNQRLNQLLWPVTMRTVEKRLIDAEDFRHDNQ